MSSIRAGSINSFDESSVQAQLCKLKYAILRDRCLREITWQFNHSIRPLSLLTTELFTWMYAYSYPVDCLKIHRLIGSYEEIQSNQTGTISRLLDDRLITPGEVKQQIPYEVYNVDGAKVIGTNQADLRIDFAVKVTDPNLFSDDFIMALSHLLAAELAIPIVGAELGRMLRGDSMKLYKGYLASAISNDMNDQYNIVSESDFVTVRN